MANSADASVVEILSDNDENTTYDESLRPLSPEPLPSVAGEMYIVLNGKSLSTLASPTLNVNVTFEQFMDRLDSCISHKTRQPLQAIQDAKKTYCYIWMTKAKSQQKTLPLYTDFEGEEQYLALQKAIFATSKKNPQLDDMMLRFHVTVRIRKDEEEENEGGDEEDEPASPSRLTGRQVSSLI